MDATPVSREAGAAAAQAPVPASVPSHVPLRRTSPLDERALLIRYHVHGDVAARQALAERMLPLVRRLAHRYAGRGENLDDLVQVGSLGLLKAIDRFDVSRDLRLSTFAVPTILGEIKRHFRDRVWALRVPRDIQELNAKLSRAMDRLTVLLGRSPTVDELAVATESTPERVLDALQGSQAFSAVSLDEPLGDGRQPLDTLGELDEDFEAAERRELLSHGLESLPGREREILRLRFFQGMTQREIADRVGISQMHVSRLIRRSLDHVRGSLD
jgi:RNA polymerase sigma-B factor